MRGLQFRMHMSCARIRRKINNEWMVLKITYHSLFFNAFTSCNTLIDTALEPVMWFVDHFVRYLGPLFVLLVVVLTTSVVVIFYTCLLPHKYNQSIFWTCYHMVFGHWLLVNIVFNYFMAAFTDPGKPPEKIPEVVSICKKCISPKPPRSHHCSICNKCILKMDHHCPWLNNCIGHFNHRYFFLFCVYMWIGTVYVSFSGFELFKEHFFGQVAPNSFLGNLLYKKKYEEAYAHSSTTSSNAEYVSQLFHHCIIYEFMLCMGTSIALGLLTLWHGRLIQRAETSIEIHINKKEKHRLKKKGLVFRNPYYFGIWSNWKIFLGLTKGRSFWRHILLPSTHPPDSDGLTWHTSTHYIESSVMQI